MGIDYNISLHKLSQFSRKNKIKTKARKKIEPGLIRTRLMRFFVIYEIVYFKETASRTKGAVSINLEVFNRFLKWYEF